MSTLKYLDGRYNKAFGTRDAFGRLSDDLVAEGYPPMSVNSGDREPQDQIDIFLSKFVPSSGPKDVGPYNDRRFWPGHGWFKRVVGGGTVGVPGTSNHEKRRANDLQYPYNSNTAAHRRAQVLAKRHNITCEGLGFSEWWHWTFWGPLGSLDAPASGSSSSPEEDDMPYTPEELKKLVKDALIELKGNDERNVLDSVIQTRAEVNDAGGKVWRNPLTNPLTGQPMPAKDFLRYLPHHHRDIILEVRALNLDQIAKLSDAQLTAYITAATAEQSRRKK